MKKIAPYVFEFFTVLLSVYLAFVITEWQDRQKNKERTRLAKERLNKEILYNFTKTCDDVNNLSNQLITIQRIEPIFLKRDQSFMNKLYKFGGFHMPQFKDAAWQRILNTDIGNYLSAEYVEDAFSLYKSNANIEEHSKICNKLIYNIDFTDPQKCQAMYQLFELHIWQLAVWSLGAQRAYLRYINSYPKEFNSIIEKDTIFYRSVIECKKIGIDRLREKNLEIRNSLDTCLSFFPDAEKNISVK